MPSIGGSVVTFPPHVPPRDFIFSNDFFASDCAKAAVANETRATANTMRKNFISHLLESRLCCLRGSIPGPGCCGLPLGNLVLYLTTTPRTMQAFSSNSSKGV